MTNEQKLREALQKVRQKFIECGGEDHPWIPGIYAPQVMAMIDEALSQPPTSDEGTPQKVTKYSSYGGMIEEPTGDKVDGNCLYVRYSDYVELERTIHAKERELGEETWKREITERNLEIVRNTCNELQRQLATLPSVSQELERRKQKEELEQELEGNRFAILGMPLTHPLHPDNALHNRAFQYWHDTMVGVGMPGFPISKEKLLELVSQSVSAAPQEGKADETPEVAIGQTWKGCDPRVTRKVVGIQGDKVALRETQTNRLSYASKSRFHGRSGGYVFVSGAPQNEAVMNITEAERREVEKLCEESSDGYVRVRCDVLNSLLSPPPATPRGDGGEPVAIVDAGDDGMFAEILPNVTVKVGQHLYAAPQSGKKEDGA